MTKWCLPTTLKKSKIACIRAGGGTLDLGASTELSLRIAKIAPYDGTAAGVQETDADGKRVVYTMDLPQELVPNAKTADGKSKLVNPDEPYVFFQYGKIAAKGGIYTKADNPDAYELDVMFENVVDQIDISGGLQYAATVSNDLQPGQTVNLIYVPGGKLSFKVTPAETPKETPAYSLDLVSTGWPSDTEMGWNLKLTDNQEHKLLPNTALNVFLDSGHAIYWNVSTTNVNKIFTVEVTYTDGTSATLYAQQMGMSTFYFYDSNKVRFDGSLRWVEITFDKGDYSCIANPSGGTPQSLISNFNIRLGGYGTGSSYEYADQPNDIASVTVKFNSRVYDNYNTTGKSYTINASSTIDDKTYTANSGNGKGWGMASASLSHSNGAYKSLGNQVNERTNTIKVNQSGSAVTSNLYEFQYNPSVSNSLNAYWYFCPWAFYGRAGLVKQSSSDSSTTSFETFNVGGNTSWTYFGNADFSYGTNKSTGDTQGNGSDLILQYQVQQMFPYNYTSLHAWRSSYPVNGKYIWVIIDPDSYDLAYRETDRGTLTVNPASQGTSGNGYDVNKPASWKLYIMNAPKQDMTISFKERLGASFSYASQGGGSITNQVQWTSAWGNSGSYLSASTTDGDGNATQSMVTSHGEWVNDDTVRWDVTLDAKGLVSNPDYGSYSYYGTWRTTNFRFKLSNNQSLITQPITTADGKTFNPALYVKEPYSDSYSTVTGLSSPSYSLDSGASLPDSNTKSALSSGFDSYNNYCWFTTGYDGSQQRYADSNGLIHYVFFTKVTKPIKGEYGPQNSVTMQPELCFMTGDLTSASFGSGNSTYSLKTVGREARCMVPGLSKSLGASSTGTNAEGGAMLDQTWTVRANMNRDTKDWNYLNFNRYDKYGSTNSPDYELFDGYFSGHYAVHDDMSDSTVVDADGKAIDPAPGTYTHLTSMHIGNGGGPVFSTSSLSPNSGSGAKMDKSMIYIDADTIQKAVEASDHKVTLSYTGHGSYWKTYPVTVTLTYSGNMQDGFDVSIEGLKNFQSLDITYTTSFDEAAYAKAAGRDAFTNYFVKFQNGAQNKCWKDSSSVKPYTSVTGNFNAALAVTKAVDDLNIPAQTDAEAARNYTHGYEITGTVGYSPTSKVSFTDIVTSYVGNKSKDDDGNDNTKWISKKSALDALGTSLSVDAEHMKITMLNPETSKAETVYENGRAEAGWTVDYQPSEGMELFTLEISKADGSNIPANTKFTVKYAMTLNPETVVGEHDGKAVTFRDSVYYAGDDLNIKKNVKGVIPYTDATSDADAGQMGNSDDAGTSAAKAYFGRNALFNRATTMSDSADAASAPDPLDAEAFAKEKPISDSAYENRVDKDASTLTCFAGAGVDAQYLARPNVVKNVVGTPTAQAILLPTYPENKNLRYIAPQTITWAIDGFNGTRGKQTNTFELRDYYKWELNDIYELDKDEPTEKQVQVLGTLDQLLRKYTTYQNLKVYYDGTDTSDVVALRGQSPAYTYDGVIPAQIDKTQTSVPGADVSVAIDSSQTMTVTLEGDAVSYGQYASFTYDTVVDWDAFYKEATTTTIDGQPLIDPDTYIVVGSEHSVMPQLMKNTVDINGGGSAEKSSGEIGIETTTLSKQCTSSNADDGFASWAVDATVSAVTGDTLTVSDTVTAAEDTDAARAALAATSIKNVKVTQVTDEGSTEIYDGSQENPYATGWSSDNLQVDVDGLTVKATVKDTENNPVLTAGQTYRLTYDTVLDKAAYAAAGAKAGDSYTLSNAAVMNLGDVSLTGSANQSFKPSMPISASKTFDGNLTTDMTRAHWTAKAESGEVDRAGFTISDAVSADEAVLPYLSITAMTIKVTDAEGNTATYDPTSLPEGATLTRADGSAFTLAQNGQADFKLTFDKLSANTTVEVGYEVSLDKDAYAEAGGEQDVSLALANALTATSADGYAAKASENGTVVAPKQFGKAGEYQAKDKDGYPLYQWKLDVNLLSAYTPDELSKLDEVTISDPLGQATPYVEGSLKVFPRTTDGQGTTVSSQPLDPSEYTVQVEGNTLVVKLDPKKYTNVELVFQTRLLANIDNLNNTAQLTIDGKTTSASDTPTPGARLLKENAYIVSYAVPVFTPTAVKFLDGAQLTGSDYVFGFRAQGADADGNVIEQGHDGYYDSQVTNNENGNVTFDLVKYRGEGTYYYKITETGLVKDDTGANLGYTLDDTSYLVKVTVVKGQTEYQVFASVVSPNGCDQAKFENSLLKTRSLTVTKDWNDASDAAGIRPPSVTVHLVKNGQRVEGGQAELSADNGWSYTWNDLAIDGSQYTVEEDPVAGYDTLVGETSLSEQPGAGTAGAWSVAVTNTQQKTAGLEVAKRVSGNDAYKDKTWHFTVTLDGGSYINGTFGQMEFTNGVAQVDLKDGQTAYAFGLPNGMGYTVQEDDYSDLGCETTSKDAQGTLDNKTIKRALFVNTLPNTPPETPNQPGGDTPSTPDQQTSQPVGAPALGDASMNGLAASAALAVVACLVAVVAGWRIRRQK